MLEGFGAITSLGHVLETNSAAASGMLMMIVCQGIFVASDKGRCATPTSHHSGGGGAFYLGIPTASATVGTARGRRHTP